LVAVSPLFRLRQLSIHAPKLRLCRLQSEPRGQVIDVFVVDPRGRARPRSPDQLLLVLVEALQAALEFRQATARESFQHSVVGSPVVLGKGLRADLRTKPLERFRADGENAQQVLADAGPGT